MSSFYSPRFADNIKEQPREVMDRQKWSWERSGAQFSDSMWQMEVSNERQFHVDVAMSVITNYIYHVFLLIVR